MSKKFILVTDYISEKTGKTVKKNMRKRIAIVDKALLYGSFYQKASHLTNFGLTNVLRHSEKSIHGPKNSAAFHNGKGVVGRQTTVKLMQIRKVIVCSSNF